MRRLIAIVVVGLVWHLSGSPPSAGQVSPGRSITYVGVLRDHTDLPELGVGRSGY